MNFICETTDMQMRVNPSVISWYLYISLWRKFRRLNALETFLGLLAQIQLSSSEINRKKLKQGRVYAYLINYLVNLSPTTVQQN